MGCRADVAFDLIERNQPDIENGSQHASRFSYDGGKSCCVMMRTHPHAITSSYAILAVRCQMSVHGEARLQQTDSEWYLDRRTRLPDDAQAVLT